MRELRVAGAQIDLVVGDVKGNTARILEVMRWASEARADVVLLPELAITGYPPEDLLLRDDFVDANIAALHDLVAASTDTAVVVGFVDRLDGVPPEELGVEDSMPRCLANAAAVIANGEIRGIYHKGLLPNYGVFDEARYFAPGRHPDLVFEIAGVPAGVSICEDIWSPTGPPSKQVAAGARILLNINGSPFHLGKGEERAALLADEARRNRVPVVYVNMVGGQDELVFDGESMVFDAAGTIRYRAPQFAEALFVFDIPVPEGPPSVNAITVTRRGPQRVTARPFPSLRPRLDDTAEVYEALVTGLGDYVRKNGFSSVVVGVSGGIDSALTATIAADALGPDAVWTVSMPTRYSSPGSIDDSRRLAANLGVRYDIIPIDDIFATFLEALDPFFADTEPGVAEENLQARIRGATLMALSNKFGHMVVATGNKSELAVGYATLYGDMVGGYAVLKDVFKTMVYRLARWRNRHGEVIPEATITKPPSAELRPDQKDTDSLPPYELLDEILRHYVEEDEPPAAIAARGLPADVVYRVARMVDRNEYKRRQAAPGVKITRKAFGKDRRLPITNRFEYRIPGGER